jgi:DNA-binding transcriptional ArsR family regulator
LGVTLLTVALGAAGDDVFALYPILGLLFGVAMAGVAAGAADAGQEMSDEIHPSLLLDDTGHQRVRLRILAVLAEADSADFSYLKERLDLTDGNLSRHLQVLEQAGFVVIEKGFEGRRPRTWVNATREGRSIWPPSSG